MRTRGKGYDRNKIGVEKKGKGDRRKGDGERQRERKEREERGSKWEECKEPNSTNPLPDLFLPTLPAQAHPF